MNVIQLTTLDLVIAASLVLLLGILAISLKLEISKSLYIAAARTTIQLSLIGLVLKFLFDNLQDGTL